MIKQILTKQFATFLLTGSIAAAVNFFSRIAYSLVLPFYVSVAVAYLTGMVASYFLMRRYVFSGHETPLGKSVSTFVAINLISLLQNWLVTMAMEYYVLPTIGEVQYSAYIASIVGIAVPVMWSFFGYKRFSFSAAQRAQHP